FIEVAERSPHDAIMIIRRALKNSTVVMEISWYLRQHARTIAGKSQLFINALAKALEEGSGVSIFRKESTVEDGKGTAYWYDGDSTIGHRLFKEITKVEFMKMKGKGLLTQPTNSYQCIIVTEVESFKQIDCVPKHSFITWLAMKNRLKTRSFLVKIGKLKVSYCSFCDSEEENRDHLYFNCPFTKLIWSKVISSLGYSRTITGWDEETQWIIRKAIVDPSRGKILKIAFSDIVYHVWLERNARQFKNESTTGDIIYRKIFIEASYKCRIYNHKFLFSRTSHNFIKDWGLNSIIKQPRSIKWVSWKQDFDQDIILNVDGCITPDRRSFGGIFRLPNGLPILAFNIKFTEEGDIGVIEIKALCKVLRIAENLGFPSLCSITDSTYTTKVLKKECSPPWKCFADLRDASIIMDNMENSNIMAKVREGNKVAEYIASSMDIMEDYVFFPCTFSQPLINLCTADTNCKLYPRL
ncbi:hypothetical protein GIB67_023733, partial [Kingdonia uniflora]